MLSITSSCSLAFSGPHPIHTYTHSQMPNPPIIELLNRPQFSYAELFELLELLKSDPDAASSLGTHRRSAIWVCCQHSDCRLRRAVVPPLLVWHGADVNHVASNNMSPLVSLYKAWHRMKPADREHKRRMALMLVHECRATIPYCDHKCAPINITNWLNGSAVNLEVLE